MLLEISGLVKEFGDVSVLRGVDLAVEEGTVVCLVGSSGSGKSTLLRCINLLEQPTGGTILIGAWLLLAFAGLVARRSA